MNILSIDVGIKNLAYCLFKIDNNCEILKWDVVNLCFNEKKNCCECAANAVFEKKDFFFCRKHAKKKDILIPKFTEVQLKKMRHKELFDYYKEINKENNILKQKTTKNRLLELIKDIHDVYYFNHIKTVKASEIDLIKVGINLRNQFSLIFQDIVLDKVLIENQISPLANRMKTVQGMITQYFIMKGIEDIVNVSSINKLKYFLEEKKTTYDERKKMSVSVTKKIVSNHFKEIDIDNLNSKKKDDLSDCLLQGLYYLIENKLISNVYCEI